MNQKGRLLVGLVTTGVLLSVGSLMLVEGQTLWGGIAVVFGIFRAAVLFRQVQSGRAE